MAPYRLDQHPISGTVMAYVEMENEGQPSVELSNEDEEVEEVEEVYPPPSNVFPESLPLENSLPQLLMSQCGMSDEYELADQTSIRLRVISKEISLQRLSIYMPFLIELDLSGSWLLSLRDLGCGLRIKILKVSQCGLDCLDGLFGLATLKELHASSNCIKDIGSCTVLPRLQLLDVSRNRIDDLGSISFLSICSQLRDLNLSENPVSSYPEYRDVVLDVLQGLFRLDGEMLAVDEAIGSTDGGHKKGGKGSTNITEDSKNCIDLNADVSRTPIGTPSTNQNIQPAVGKRERPSTSIGFRQSQHTAARLERPHTAGSNDITRNTFNDDNAVCSEFHGLEENPASRLTSGRIVCGNLAASLRGRQRPMKNENDESRSRRPIKSSNVTLQPIGIAELVTAVVEEDTKESATMGDVKMPKELKIDNWRSKEVKALIEASRQWRVTYSKFRDINSEKWAKEYSDNDNSEDEGEQKHA